MYRGSAVLEHFLLLHKEGIKVAPLSRLVEVRPKQAISIAPIRAC